MADEAMIQKAKKYEQKQMYVKAAEIYYAEGMKKEAAGMYEKAGAYLKAEEIYEKLGMKADAERCKKAREDAVNQPTWSDLQADFQADRGNPY